MPQRPMLLAYHRESDVGRGKARNFQKFSRKLLQNLPKSSKRPAMASIDGGGEGMAERKYNNGQVQVCFRMKRAGVQRRAI